MKKLYLLTAFAFMFAPFAIADNPGVEDEVAEPVVQETNAVPVAQEEEVVQEASSAAVVEDTSDDEVVSLEKVVVTGSRIKRTQQEGALPLLVITKEDINNSGFRNVTEAYSQFLLLINIHRTNLLQITLPLTLMSLTSET